MSLLRLYYALLAYLRVGFIHFNATLLASMYYVKRASE